MTEPEPIAPSRTGRPVQQPELEGIDTNTRPMWVIAVLPLVGLLLNLVPDPPGAPFRAGEPVGDVVLDAIPPVLSLALVVLELVLAAQDRRFLLARGIIRPMHWGWALLDGVYVIGRAVVVRRRVRGSLRPLALWAALTGLALVTNFQPF